MRVNVLTGKLTYIFHRHHIYISSLIIVQIERLFSRYAPCLLIVLLLVFNSILQHCSLFRTVLKPFIHRSVSSCYLVMNCVESI